MVGQDKVGKTFTDDQKKEVSNAVTLQLGLQNNPRFGDLFKAMDKESFDKALNADAVKAIKGLTETAIKNVSHGKEAFPREPDHCSHSPQNLKNQIAASQAPKVPTRTA